MAYEMIKTDVVGRVGIIWHNRPEKMNAIHPVMGRERSEQIQAWNADPKIGAIVVTGEGRAFCAGADVGGWKRRFVDTQAAGAPPASRGEGTAGRGDVDARTRAQGGAGWVRFCMDSKPLIAAINGPSIGAGLTSILPFDVRVASDRARLSMRFIRIGIFPELNSTHILPHIVGIGHALELMLTGKTIDAHEAARIGLVNHVVPHEKLMEKTLEIAQAIAANPSMHVRGVKEVTWKNLDEADPREVQQLERVWLGKATTSPEFREAVRAFLEKRTPDFHDLPDNA
jgi:enoyl-CoA hydratase/carnithine racemase